MNPPFSQLAHHLVGHHPPKSQETAYVLGGVRAAFDDLIDQVATVVPPSPEATIAARSIHRACQDVIAAIILNQEG